MFLSERLGARKQNHRDHDISTYMHMLLLQILCKQRLERQIPGKGWLRYRAIVPRGKLMRLALMLGSYTCIYLGSNCPCPQIVLLLVPSKSQDPTQFLVA